MVTVLFNDVVGSTQLGEHLDPESLRRVIFRYFAEMQAVVERMGGTVPQFMGDAVMAVFGIPTAHEDDALRAVRAAWEMQSALNSLNDSLESDWGVRIATRTGINTGRVVIGDPVRGQGIVVGDAVNVAARLEQAAATSEVLLGEATYRLVRDAVTVGEPRTLELKGKSETVRAWPVLDVASIPTTRRRRLDAPLVGRARERALLQNIFDRTVIENQCQLVTVLGDPGVGKTRLIEELASANLERANVLRGRCLPYGEGITFWPILEIVQQAAGITADDSSDEARRKVELAVRHPSDDPVIAEVVSQIVGLGETTAATEQVFWALRKWFEALAHQKPVVLLLDDIQWAEPTFLSFLEHLADWSREIPILMLCVAREELLDLRPDWTRRNAAVLSLSPLTEAECAALLDSLLGAGRLEEQTSSFILSAVQGNPLFLEEMLLMLIEEGHIRRDNGRWITKSDVPSLPAPPNIQALLSARLDGLTSEERQVIERAAVMGAHFSARAIADLTDEPERLAVGDHLIALTAKEILQPHKERLAEAPTYRFRHILIRDAAYDAVPKESLAQLHEAYADWLLKTLGEREQEYEEIIGYHLEQACRHRLQLGRDDAHTHRLASAAFERLESAADRALARGDLAAGIKLLERAAAALSENDPRRLRLLPRIGDTLVFAGRFPEAEPVLEEAIKRAEQSGDTEVDAHARVARAILHMHTHASTITQRDALEIAQHAMKTMEQSGNDRSLAGVGYGLAYALLVQGHLSDAQAEFRRAIERSISSEQPSVEATARRTLLVAVQMGPMPAPEMIREAQTNLEWARDMGERLLEARALAVMGVGLAMQGDFTEAKELARQSTAILSDMGTKARLAYSAFEVAEIHMLEGDILTAEVTLRASEELLDELGDTGVRSTIAALLADALYAQERLDEAESLTRLSEEISDPTDALSHSTWRRVRAKVVSRQGQVQTALDLAEEAVRLAKGTDFLTATALALTDLSEVLTRAGRIDDARATLEEALGTYRRKGNSVGAERARTMMARLLGEL